MRRILVTGATGFVGGFLCEALTRSGFLVRAALHVDRPLPEYVTEGVVIGDIVESTDWTRSLDGVDAVVHLAAKAHFVGGWSVSSDEYHVTNALGTKGLIRSAVMAGVRRFIYLSSVKVNGEGLADRPYTALDAPRPQDAYAMSKWMGERFVMEVATGSAPDRIIVRSPLVYGPGVRANFLRLIRWVEAGWPIPLGAVHNLRSMIGVWNLAHLLLHVLSHSAAAGKTWMASDGLDLSTPQLMAQIGAAMGRRVRLVSVPVGLLRLGGDLFGRDQEIARLCSSLTVDISETCQQLGWSPPLSVAEGIQRTVRWYMSKGRASGSL
jgi:nucleoside-diphosphate-sugar epimerase